MNKVDINRLAQRWVCVPVKWRYDNNIQEVFNDVKKIRQSLKDIDGIRLSYIVQTEPGDDFQYLSDEEFLQWANNQVGKRPAQVSNKSSLQEEIEKKLPREKDRCEYLATDHVPIENESTILLYGDRKAGKSIFTLTKAYSIALNRSMFTGDDAGSDEQSQCPAFIVDAELSLKKFEKRDQHLQNFFGVNPDAGGLIYRFLRRQEFKGSAQQLDIADDSVQQLIEERLAQHLADISGPCRGCLLVLDCLQRLTSQGKWSEVINWITRLSDLGVTVILVHHTGPEGGSKGYSLLPEGMDAEIQILDERPSKNDHPAMVIQMDANNIPPGMTPETHARVHIPKPGSSEIMHWEVWSEEPTASETPEQPENGEQNAEKSCLDLYHREGKEIPEIAHLKNVAQKTVSNYLYTQRKEYIRPKWKAGEHPEVIAAQLNWTAYKTKGIIDDIVKDAVRHKMAAGKTTKQIAHELNLSMEETEDIIAKIEKE